MSKRRVDCPYAVASDNICTCGKGESHGALRVSVIPSDTPQVPCKQPVLAISTYPCYCDKNLTNRRPKAHGCLMFVLQKYAKQCWMSQSLIVTIVLGDSGCRAISTIEYNDVTVLLDIFFATNFKIQ